jgi:hypothetical protein
LLAPPGPCANCFKPYSAAIGVAVVGLTNTLSYRRATSFRTPASGRCLF